ncbi:hypothetical protein GCM10010519_63130 [Streptomyces lactacystinicus]
MAGGLSGRVVGRSRGCAQGTVAAGAGTGQRASGIRMTARARHDTRPRALRSHSSELPGPPGNFPPSARECLGASNPLGTRPHPGRVAYRHPATGTVLDGRTTHLHRSIIYYFLSRLVHFP